MPQKTPHDIVAQNKARVTQYVQERLRRECAAHGSAAALAKKLGFKEPTIANAKNHGRIGPGLAEALAEHWGMSHDQLKRVAAGQQEAPLVPEPPVEPTPQTPPAKSDVRAKQQVADHWFPDEVEELYARAIKIKAEVDYSVPVGRVAKVFVRDATHQLKKGVTRLDLMLIALDTARAIEASGGELTPGAIYGAMISEAIEHARPRTGETPLERLLREADEKNQREGIVADLPGWIPKPSDELPPEIPAHTPRLRLPPLPPAPAPPPSSTSPVSAPPPASGPVRKGKSRGRR